MTTKQRILHWFLSLPVPAFRTPGEVAGSLSLPLDEVTAVLLELSAPGAPLARNTVVRSSGNVPAYNRDANEDQLRAFYARLPA